MIIGKGATGQGLDYNVDLVMCIDGTGSMGHIIKEVKENALTFYKKFTIAMEEVDKSVQQLRVKIILFRDIGVDSDSMVESKFFVLGEDGEDEEFHKFVDSIEAVGGGDLPESSLEALALAINSDWVRTGSVRRHVIHMYTDAPALKLGEKSSCAGYPAGMPADLAELREWWDGQRMELRAKRLQIFAPDTEPWSDIATWSNAFHVPGVDLKSTDLDTCIHLLVQSI